jgi:hypothetical protein
MELKPLVSVELDRALPLVSSDLRQNIVKVPNYTPPLLIPDSVLKQFYVDNDGSLSQISKFRQFIYERIAFVKKLGSARKESARAIYGGAKNRTNAQDSENTCIKLTAVILLSGKIKQESAWRSL